MSILNDLLWKRDSNLSVDEFNRRAKVIADTLEELRAFSPSWEAEVSALRQVGLERINQALIPAYEQIIELANLGSLLSAESSTEIDIGLGTKTLLITEAQRKNFAPSAYLLIYSGETFANSMTARTASYDFATGILVVSVQSVTGSGTFSDWTIGPIASTDDIEALRSDVEDIAATVAADKAFASAKATAAADAASGAVTAKAAAELALASLRSIYYGPRPTAPSGAALGAQYLDTSTVPNVVKVLTSTGWAPVVTVSIGGSRQQVYVATAGQTEFTVDGGFTAGSVNIGGVEFYHGHGVTLTPNTSKFTTSAMTAGQIVAFSGYLANNVTDILTKEEVGTLLLTKQGASTVLSLLASVTPAANKMIRFLSNATVGLSDAGTKGLDLLSATNMAGALAKLGPAYPGDAPDPSSAGIGLVNGNFNTLVAGGYFDIDSINSASWINGPSAISTVRGVLLVIKSNHTQPGIGSYDTVIQTLHTDSNTIWRRKGTRLSSGGGWSFDTWRRYDNAYRPDTILGDVSMSGGVPAGALFERGSNGNGIYTRFADGTQICRGVVSGGGASTADWTFPAEFSTATGLGISIVPNESSPSFARLAKVVSHTTADMTFLAHSINVSSGAVGGSTVSHRITAIGYWS